MASYVSKLMHRMEYNLSQKEKRYPEEILRVSTLPEFPLVVVVVVVVVNQKEVKIIPILVSATGIVPKDLFNSLKEIGLSQSVYIELQKQAILGTCHIVRKFMSQ
jgi:hypothetical protein